MIFCVEDDSGIRDLMIYTLNAAGFEAVGFGDDAAFWEAMKQQRPELILLERTGFPFSKACVPKS